ncbi:MAG: redoxin domain-containing protein [Planctomycetaceae bacterium]|jgi:thioredoxin 1|nr:redoxin domain-containing protein [Planctomycetaceae bacterium]
MGEVSKIESEEAFDTVIKTGIVLVDFFATWCGPCRMQGRLLEELATSPTGDKVKIVKVDTDHLSSVTQRFDISNIPTLLLYNNGNLVERLTGLQQQNVLEQKINAIS